MVYILGSCTCTLGDMYNTVHGSAAHDNMCGIFIQWNMTHTTVKTNGSILTNLENLRKQLKMINTILFHFIRWKTIIFIETYL